MFNVFLDIWLPGARPNSQKLEGEDSSPRQRFDPLKRFLETYGAMGQAR
jgi:hypothetical protein